jgi:Protein of unknown function (DUF3800)
MADKPSAELLILKPNTLVFYVDESGDERLNDKQHPIFAFGGVACSFDFHLPIARAWQAMKAENFPQVDGPLHANTHLRDRLSETRRQAVLTGMAHPKLARFGTVITSSTVVPLDWIFTVACMELAKRFASVAEGMMQLGLWKVSGRVVAVFEHSTRLAKHFEQHFTGLVLEVGGHSIPVEGSFMPKSVVNPFLEMADFVASAIGKNVKHQQKSDPSACTDNFQALFRKIGPPLAAYAEVVGVGPLPPGGVRMPVVIHARPNSATLKMQRT